MHEVGVGGIVAQGGYTTYPCWLSEVPWVAKGHVAGRLWRSRRRLYRPQGLSRREAVLLVAGVVGDTRPHQSRLAACLDNT